MKARYLEIVLAAAVAFSLVGCAKKEPTEKPAEAPATPAAAPIDLSTAGTVAGSVKLEGTPAKPTRIRMDAEAACVALHTTPVYSEQIVTGERAALANVVVYVKQGLGDRTFATPSGSVVIDQKGCTYQPHVIGLQANQTLEVTNSDPTTHNIHPVPQNNREWNKSQAPKGEKISEKFAREELAIPVKCNVHPWMKSYIAVIKHPYFQVTDKAGTFELKNLPPGEYTIGAWHEKLGETEQKVTLGAKETKKIEFVFKGQAGD
jgi:plastocyanin/predicted small lipoprotein YifL